MKRFNFPLWTGTILLSILLLISFFPEKFATKDPNYKQQLRTYYTMEDGIKVHKVDLGTWGPNEDNLMGVDDVGRDIYSRIIYGTKTTLKTGLLIVLLRLLVAIPIGIIAGIGSRVTSSAIKFFNTVFTAIPTLFLAFFILNIDYIRKLEVQQSIVSFAIVLTALGWGKLARQVEERVSKIMKEEFIEGEIAIGKSMLQITFQNMIPHLVPSLISLMFIEFSLVIFLLAQLSVLEVFVGPRIEFVRWGGSTPVFLAENPEWGSMLSRILVHNRTGRYWIGLFPALAFAVGILAFNLTGEGLRIEFEKRTSRVASFIRNMGFLVSPRIYFQQLIRYKEYRKPVIIKSLIIVIAIAYLFMPAPKSLYPFDAELAMVHIEELTDPKYEGRLTGFDGSYNSGNYIVQKLKEYGLEPYDGEEYFQSFSVTGYNLRSVQVEDAEIILISKEGESFTYDLSYFNINSINRDELFYPKSTNDNGVIELKVLSKPIDYEDNTVIPKDIQHIVQMEEEDYMTVIGKTREKNRSSNSTKMSITYIEDLPKDSSTFLNEFYSITVTDELGEKLKEDVFEVVIRIKKLQLPNYEGRNIFAVLPGKDWNEALRLDKKKEIIIIGASYDGIGMIGENSSAMRASGAAINLEIARVLSELEMQLDKTVIFAFWDGESSSNSGSRYYNVQDRIYTQDYYRIFYFDIGSANNDDEISIYLYTVPQFQIETFDMNNDIVKNLNKKKIKFKVDRTGSSSYYNVGINMILKVSVDGSGYYKWDTPEDTPEYINKKQLSNMGQYYIDLITMDENFK